MAKTLGFTLVTLMLASPFRLAYGGADPLAVQNKAIAEVRACQATYRRTGACDQAQLNDAKANLLQSNEAFHARGNYGAEALGDIFLAKIAGLISPGQSATEQFALYKSAAGLAQQGGNADYQSRALTGLAYVEGQEQNNISAGLSDATAAVDLATRANNSVDLFDALTTRAIVEARGSDINGASNDYNRAVAIVNRVNDVNLVMSGYLDMEIIWQDQGTECQKNSQNPSICEQEYGYARTDLEKAAQIAHAQGYAFVIAQLIEPRQKELALLESELSKGQELRGQLATASATHITNASQVVMLRQFSPYENPDTAKTMSQLLSQFGPLNASDERAPYLQGMLLEAEGKNDQALSSYMKAVSLLEQDRRSLQDPQSRTAFLSDRTEFYYAAILELLDHQRYSEAFALMERARARALADLLANRPPRVAKPEEQQLLAESLSINAQLAKDQQSLYNLTPGPDTNDEIQRLQAAIQGLERQSAAVQSKIATQAPELNRLMAANPVSLQQAQAQARAGGYDLICYLTLDQGLIVWHINGDGVQVRGVLFIRDLVNKDVTALGNSLSDVHSNFDDATAKELYLVAVSPILRFVKSNHLVIIPHGELTLLPFQVLEDPSNGSYLGERYAISYAPSATILATLATHPNVKNGKLLGVEGPGIPNAPQEVSHIAALYPGRHLVVDAKSATKERVSSLVGGYSLIHFSVHGQFDGSDPMLSFLLLTPSSSAENGRLTAAEMFALPLQRNSLVVLSACETGQVVVTSSNETLGMVQALLYAGATNVVLSDWAVNDQSTQIWMETFYREAQTHPAPEAARLALIAVRENPEFHSPFFWGPFVMTGR